MAPSFPRQIISVLCFMLSLCFTSSYPVIAVAQDAPLPTVTYAVIGERPAAQPLYYIGRVEAINLVDVHTRTDGFIQRVYFDEGQMVNAGDTLFTLEPSVQQSAVDLAKAQVRGMEATLALSETANTRTQSLLRNRAVSQADADRSMADLDVARAGLLQAQANQRAMELQLSFTQITAPISGRIGHTDFSVGSYVSAASRPLVTIAQLDPIRVVLSIRERDFISATLGDNQLHLDLLGKDFAPQLRLANGKIFPERGTLDSISNRIDPLTGTVEIRARFNNPQLLLLPGGVVDVTLEAQEPPMMPVVPAAALQQDSTGFFVLLLDENDTVEMRPVTLGVPIDQYYVVETGLTPGDRVIVEGLQQVRPGVVVRPVPQQL